MWPNNLWLNIVPLHDMIETPPPVCSKLIYEVVLFLRYTTLKNTIWYY